MLFKKVKFYVFGISITKKGRAFYAPRFFSQPEINVGQEFFSTDINTNRKLQLGSIIS